MFRTRWQTKAAEKRAAELSPVLELALALPLEMLAEVSFFALLPPKRRSPLPAPAKSVLILVRKIS